MSIKVNGKEYRTLSDHFEVNGRKCVEAYANGVKCYPEKMTWTANSSYIASSEGQYLGTVINDNDLQSYWTRRFYKTNGGRCVVAFLKVFWANYGYVTGPYVFSPERDAVECYILDKDGHVETRTVSNATVEYGGITWYVNSQYGLQEGFKPTVDSSFPTDLTQRDYSSSMQALANAVLAEANVVVNKYRMGLSGVTSTADFW